MKRWLLPVILPLLFVACSESDIPVKEVRSCSNVTKVELVKRPSLAWFAADDNIYVRLTVATGRYFYNETWEYTKREGRLLEIATKMEIGKEYCWTTYEPIK